MSKKKLQSGAVREQALGLTRGDGKRLGWLDVLEEGLQFAKPEEGKDRPEVKNMAIAIDCAKELRNLAVPRLTTQKVDEDKKRDRTMIVPDASAYLPEDTEEL